MYQRGTIQTTATPTAELADSWPHPLIDRGFLRSLRQLAILPHDLHGFLRFVLGLSVVIAALCLHLILAADVLEAEIRLGELRREHTLIQQQNAEIIWQITQLTALNKVQDQAQPLGYRAGPQKIYQYKVLGTPYPQAQPDGIVPQQPDEARNQAETPVVVEQEARPTTVGPREKSEPGGPEMSTAEARRDRWFSALTEPVQHWWQGMIGDR